MSHVNYKRLALNKVKNNSPTHQLIKIGSSNIHLWNGKLISFMIKLKLFVLFFPPSFFMSYRNKITTSLPWCKLWYNKSIIVFLPQLQNILAQFATLARKGFVQIHLVTSGICSLKYVTYNNQYIPEQSMFRI